jgi:lysyl oxidase-like protein 2/3/4
VARGAKQAFCLRDNFRYLANAPESRGYDCENQGLTSGWEDVYDKSLDCQWLDITGIRPGTYTMRATVNRNRKLKERNHGNNSFRVRISIPTRIPLGSPAEEAH